MPPATSAAVTSAIRFIGIPPGFILTATIRDALSASYRGQINDFLPVVQGGRSGRQRDLLLGPVLDAVVVLPDEQQRAALLDAHEELVSLPCLPELGPSQLAGMEPGLQAPAGRAFFLEEFSVDARALMTASLEAARSRRIQMLSGVAATGVEPAGGRTLQVTTDRDRLQAPIVVNCAGAWAGQVPPHKFPTRPVKGQMLAVAAPEGLDLRHVVRAPSVYVVPRSDGRILIGATQEEAGFDRSVDPKAIERLHQAAAAIFPALGSARVVETWSGLRPGTPDALPILGPTPMPGYFVAAGHFRNGFLLAPLTAQAMAMVIRGSEPPVDITRFSPSRFER